MAITTPSARAAIWAENGTKTQPSDGAVDSGYLPPPAKPGRQTTNWLLFWLDNAVQYLLAWMANFNTNVNALIDSRIGTLSAVVTTGIAASTGTISLAHTMNFPNSTHKILAFQLALGLADAPTTITLSGDAAFVHGIRSVQVCGNASGIVVQAITNTTFQIDTGGNAQIQVAVTGY